MAFGLANARGRSPGIADIFGALYRFINDDMALDLTSFEKAVVSLEEALQAHAVVKDSAAGEFLRDAVIKRFEYTFELSWKFLKRYIEVYGLEWPDGFTHKELFRVGFEQGMIRDSAPWFEYLKKRNLTSYMYDKNVAEVVFRSAAPFLPGRSRRESERRVGIVLRGVDSGRVP